MWTCKRYADSALRVIEALSSTNVDASAVRAVLVGVALDRHECAFGVEKPTICPAVAVLVKGDRRDTAVLVGLPPVRPCVEINVLLGSDCTPSS